MEKRISIADMEISAGVEDILIAEEIGAGMGLAVYDPVSRVGGILHFLLPASDIDWKIAEKLPFMFADTAIPRFLKAFVEHGGQKERAKILAAGGSGLMDPKDVLNIGKQNYRALMDMLDMTHIRPDIEDVGGHANRGLEINIHTGDMVVRTSGTRQEVKT